MKPIKLTLSGLKSFNEKATVDFENLLKGGMFGIFGDTGSGKSTLLDAIVYALYANFDKEHINKRANKTYVDFIFEITVNAVRKTYEVERTFYYEKPSQSKLYEITDDGKFCIAEKTKDVNDKIFSIIGLKSSEFEQCIVLPQGKFDKFLSATRGDRINIIENLFGLEKYGVKLKYALDSVRAEIYNKYTEKNAVLVNLADYTKDGLNELKSQFESLGALLKQENEKLNKSNDYIAKYETFYNDKKRVEELKLKLEQLSLNEDYFVKAKDVFDVMEKLKNIVETSNELTAITGKINENKRLVENLNKQVKTVEEKFNEVSEAKKVKLPQLTKQRDLLNVKIQNAKNYSDLYVEYLADVKKIKELKTSFNENENKITSLNKTLQNLTDKRNNLQIDKDKINLTEILSSVIGKTSGSVNFEIIKDEIEYLNSLKNYDEFNGCVNIKNSVFSRIDYLTKKLKSSDEFKDNDGLNIIESVELSLKNYEAAVNKIQEVDKQISECKSEINRLSVLNEQIRVQGGDLKEKASAKKEKIASETGGQDLEFYTKTLAYDLKTVEDEIASIEKQYEKQKELFFNVNTQLSGTNSVLSVLAENYKNTENKLNSLFFDKYLTVEAAADVYDKFKDNTQLKSQTESYFTTVNSLKKEYDDKLKKLVESDFNLQEYENVKSSKENLSKNLLEISENYGKLTNTYKNYEHNFKNKCIIEDELKEIVKSRDVCDRLTKSVEKRKLLEFVADEYLKEITKLARKTVSTLSGGKYGLEYKGEFCVVDNLNGGIIRPVSTLSGGETFIVSLSLALALSQEIYAKSMRPIEFFFLDEGFGTLDKKLTEAVAESLNKLKNSNFSIGLISHVPELIEAVDAKIFVKPQTLEHGSQIICELT